MEREGFSVFESEWWHFDYSGWREYPILNLPFDQHRPTADRRSAILGRAARRLRPIHDGRNR